MADPRNPLLNPVLRFTKDPKPEGITGGGKNAFGIKADRLDRQRRALGLQLQTLAAQSAARPKFNGSVVLYAAMFDDSLAPTWTPNDLFQTTRDARLIAPYRTGYLVEVRADQLTELGRLVERTGVAKEQVDISRVESVRFFSEDDTAGSSNLPEIWDAAPKTGAGRAFVIWLMPLRGRDAAESLIQSFSALRDGVIIPPAPLLAGLTADMPGDAPALMRRSLQAAALTGDRLNLAVREYRAHRRARTTVIVPSQAALEQLVASGTVYRIEPVQPLISTSPGEGREPDRPLPANLSSLPIVGVVDGGLTAASYCPAEAWRAPPLIRTVDADTLHGNRVTSLIVQGHDWNNNLTLPSLYCQVGTVQAVAKDSVRSFVDPQDFIAYLDGIMTANPGTKVWNFSLNQRLPCQLDLVSPLGHDIAVLARKHGVLPVVSIGNKPGDLLQPPADCEAALTVGGRLHSANGSPGTECPVSLSGPGPSSMLKPDLSHFSHVRAIGGTVIAGSSFSTALTSAVAAHTMHRVRDASPDLVKALLLHNADGDGHNHTLGFGTPAVSSLPWECRHGVVTLQWKASLRAGAAYYWELPIPRSMRESGKLKGFGTLTAVLNPHPMLSDIAGPNYFSVRLATAVQRQRGLTPKGMPKFHNLLGSLETDKVTEADARTFDHKWSPIRHHHNAFQSLSFDGDALRVYARVYVRDLYLYGMSAANGVPEMETEFVLSLGTGDEDDDVYNELRDQLGAFVESAIIETDIDVDNEGG